MKNSQEIKNGKAKLLTDIMVKTLPKLGLNVITVRGVVEKGVDILAKNNENKTIGVEIKAVNKYEIIKGKNCINYW